MASTYTTGFSLEKIGSGEQSGTWGTTSNHNLDIVDRLASYKAVAITANADAHTLTVREASPDSGTENLQDGMYRVIKFTGALDSNCTVTIAPNTTPAWFVIENATTDSGTSGPYSLVLSQGSGANVTVQNGKNVMVYCDGAGSGAAVVDALADLQIGTLEVTGAAAIDGAITASGGVAATGNVTATGTVEPAGDTSASDNAAIGYTSAEGLILTGQGSTNDVTIKNDADADVITIATGGTNVDVVGDLTAATLNADGDTSAGDDAAIGYTSAEGLILTGQGSTNDVTIKNDADADVITIATGGTNVDIVGDVTASTVNADGDTSAGDNAAIGYTAAEGLILTGQGSSYDVTIKNDDDTIVAVVPTGADDLRFLDNAQAQWGTGGDLSIYHDASNSYITDVGTGVLKITSDGTGINFQKGNSEVMAQMNTDGACAFYYDNSQKLETTSTGSKTTGIHTIKNDGGQLFLEQGNSADGYQIDCANADGFLTFARRSGGGATDTDRMTLDSNGKLSIGTFSPSYHFDLRGTDAQVMRVADATPTEYFGLFNANTGAHTPNTAAATCKVRGHGTGGRSINAGGTVNASGADYAEYMTKANGAGTIEKGTVCGVNSDGKLTDVFADAHSFVIKSTDPSYVGGDVWGIKLTNSDGNETMFEADKHEVDEDGNETGTVLKSEELEAARQKVDRIAFSGQVPCLITGDAAVGDYAIPRAKDDGSIEAVAVSDPTFEQYRAAVGRVWKLNSETKKHIVSVKVS